MATHEEAMAYDRMDHSEVNRQFVDDLLSAAGDEPLQGEALDLGTGTALIPIELCSRDDVRIEDLRVVAIDLSTSMLDLARNNIEIAGLTGRIMLDLADSKELKHYEDGRFRLVMSNSIVHHLPDPRPAIEEAWRVLAPGGLLFFRDLLRPSNDNEVGRLVETHAGDCEPFQRELFENSLRAALTVEEMAELVGDLDAAENRVTQTTDRHWTWVARKQGS